MSKRIRRDSMRNRHENEMVNPLCPIVGVSLLPGSSCDGLEAGPYTME